jgi:hypothetical protein
MNKKFYRFAIGAAAVLLGARTQGASVTYDLTADNASILIDGAYLFQKTTTTSTGTGVFNTFLRQQDVGGNINAEPAGSGLTQANGFNSSSLSTASGSMNAELDASQTFDLRGDATSGSTKILTSTTQNVPGSFYTFGFDINEPNSGIQDYLSIDNLEVWVSASPILNAFGYSDLTSRSTAVDSTKTFKIYSLDKPSAFDTSTRDISVLGRAVPGSSGSGKADYAFLVPQSYFTSVPGWNGTWYVYLWSMVGGVGSLNANQDFGENSGFEEWGTLTGTTFNVPPPVPEAGTFAAATLMTLAVVGQRWLRRRRS